jgi:hypothetical protein
MWIFIAWIACAIGAGAIASAKGRSGVGYFILGMVLPLIGLLIAIGMPTIRPVTVPAALPDRSAERKCPACAEWVLKEARKCKHCGEALVPV